MAEKISFELPKFMNHEQLGSVEVIRTSYLPDLVRVTQVSTGIVYDVPLSDLKAL